MSESPKHNYWLPLVMSLLFALGIWIGSILPERKSTSADVQKLEDILTIIDKNYVDKVQKDSIFEVTITDMLHKLDPHSNYIAAKDMKQVRESIDGKFAGIGVRFMLLQDTICITNVLPNSPSQRAGVKAGDKILKVDNKSVTGRKVTNDKVMGLLKGPEDTQVKVVVLRDKKKKSLRITRGIIPLTSVTSAYMIDETTGFIRIEQFSVPTHDEFVLASKKLLDQGMKKLVLDLRFNGGGVMQVATEIADEFLQAGDKIVSTKGKSVGEKVVYATDDLNLLESIPVVVLINEASASASEILAGALQDNDRGVMVGRRTFGKGLVQEDKTLRDGSNLRLTIARYFTPSGRCIQRPYDKGYDAYMEESFQNFHYDEEKEKKELQKAKKFKTKGNRIVYGAGGIFPDIKVEYEFVLHSEYYYLLRENNAFAIFAFHFLDGKRNQFNSLNQLEEQLSKEKNLVDEFLSFSENVLKIPKDEKAITVEKELLNNYLKAEIARQLFTENGFYKIYNATDKEVKKALESFGALKK